MKRLRIITARRTRLACVGLMLVAALAPTVVAACAKDGVPSVSADGRLAVLNRSTVRGVLTTWSPFVFARPVQHGHTVTLAEDNRQVARALPRDVFTRPWRWDFGDHSKPALGTRVHHVYRKAGTYRIAVTAYYAAYGAWQPFDYVMIHVR